MRIVDTYSHFGGKEFLLMRRPTLLQEVEDAIESVDLISPAESVTSATQHLRQQSYSPIGIKNQLSDQLEALDWHKFSNEFWVTSDAELTRTVATMPVETQHRAIKLQRAEPIPASLEIEHLKDRIAVQMRLENPSMVTEDIFVTFMNHYVSDLIDVGIEILPMKELATQMSSGVAYYERDLLNIIRQGRGVPAVPLVLIGIAP